VVDQKVDFGGGMGAKEVEGATEGHGGGHYRLQEAEHRRFSSRLGRWVENRRAV
jgi:hypothetical protein